MNYLYLKNGQQHGPVSEEQLRLLLGQGSIAPHDLVWREGMSQWTPAGAALGGAVASLATPPPIPGYVAAPVTVTQPGAIAAPMVVQPHSRLAFILLGLFVGPLGIHNFYAGYTGRGVAQLLITVLTGWLIVPLLVVGIWILIEIITVTQDAQGRPFI